MRITEFPHGLTLAAPTEGYLRTPGLHASDLYGSFYRALDPKRFDKRDKDGARIPFDLPKMELGMCFEEVLEPALAWSMQMQQRLGRRHWGERPGEFTAPHDLRCPLKALAVVTGVACPTCGAGTIFSPDFLFDIDGDVVLGEFKLTWMSPKGAPTDPKFAKWWTQIKLYLHWLGLRRALLYVYFVIPDYRTPSPPIPRAWEATFTQRELRDEYDMIMRHARQEGLLQ